MAVNLEALRLIPRKDDADKLAPRLCRIKNHRLTVVSFGGVVFEGDMWLEQSSHCGGAVQVPNGLFQRPNWKFDLGEPHLPPTRTASNPTVPTKRNHQLRVA